MKKLLFLTFLTLISFTMSQETLDFKENCVYIGGYYIHPEINFVRKTQIFEKKYK